jgi:hypothetical protein
LWPVFVLLLVAVVAVGIGVPLVLHVRAVRDARDAAWAKHTARAVTLPAPARPTGTDCLGGSRCWLRPERLTSDTLVADVATRLRVATGSMPQRRCEPSQGVPGGPASRTCWLHVQRGAHGVLAVLSTHTHLVRGKRPAVVVDGTEVAVSPY